MPLNDRLRAAVFARDKGICAFSGLSLWMLDFGASPFSHPDWVDHIVPASRGGSDKLDNLISASFFHNSKKLNNSRDRSYLFQNGVPTEEFYFRIGELSQQQSELLVRNARLIESDWYFNRALFNISVALGNDSGGFEAVRGRDYWINSAYKRLETWRRLTNGAGPSWFMRRGLVRYPRAPDVRLMLSLTQAGQDELRKAYGKLLKHYRANCVAVERLARSRTRQERIRAWQIARTSRFITAPTLEAIRSSVRGLQALAASVDQ